MTTKEWRFLLLAAALCRWMSSTPGAASLLVNCEDKILRDEGEHEWRLQMEHIGSYTDRRLRRDPAPMREFMGLLARRVLLVVSSDVSGRVSLFFVRKKNGDHRPVLDCHWSNGPCRGAPSTEIATAEGFAPMVVETGRPLRIAATDIEACFPHTGSRLRLPFGDSRGRRAVKVGVERCAATKALLDSPSVSS